MAMSRISHEGPISKNPSTSLRCLDPPGHPMVSGSQQLPSQKVCGSIGPLRVRYSLGILNSFCMTSFGPMRDWRKDFCRKSTAFYAWDGNSQRLKDPRKSPGILNRKTCKHMACPKVQQLSLPFGLTVGSEAVLRFKSKSLSSLICGETIAKRMCLTPLSCKVNSMYSIYSSIMVYGILGIIMS